MATRTTHEILDTVSVLLETLSKVLQYISHETKEGLVRAFHWFLKKETVVLPFIFLKASKS